MLIIGKLIKLEFEYISLYFIIGFILFEKCVNKSFFKNIEVIWIIIEIKNVERELLIKFVVIFFLNDLIILYGSMK